MFEIYKLFLRSFFEFYRTFNYNYIFVNKRGKRDLSLFTKSQLRDQIIKYRKSKNNIAKSINKCSSKKQRDWKIHLIKELNIAIKRRKDFLK